MTDTTVTAGNETKDVVVTRFPNLEVGFFAALLAFIGKPLLEALHLVPNFTWRFISTGNCDGNVHAPNELYFDVGKTGLDHHGLENDQCSLDILRKDFDFVAIHPWIGAVAERIRRNDLFGDRISRHPQSLRELMTTLTGWHDKEPELILRWLQLAFCGIFFRLQRGDEDPDFFGPEALLRGVTGYAPDQLEWFKHLLEEAREGLRVEWDTAMAAVKESQLRKLTAEARIPHVDHEVRAIIVFSESMKVGPAARKERFNIIVQKVRSGHIQIFTGLIPQRGQKLEIHLGQMVKALREAEAKASGKVLVPDQALDSSDKAVYTDGTESPWCLPQWKTAVLNGGLSGAFGDTPVQPTVLSWQSVWKIVQRTIFACQAVPTKKPTRQVAAATQPQRELALAI